MKVVNSKFFLKALPMVVLVVCSVFDANAAPRAAVRGTAAARQPVAKAKTTQVSEPAVAVDDVVSESVETVEVPEVIMNKSTQFDDVLSSSTTTSAMGDSALTDMLREQRAKIAALDAVETGKENAKRALAGKNACDEGLRKCMSDDKMCGSDFTKCALDGDTAFGDKINKCKRDLTCTGEEIKLFSTEIKADRDLNVRLSSYNAVIDCGNEYMNCIIDECGATFGRCLGKPAENKAIDNCKSIATRCKEQDSGLSGRFGTVIGKLRENAEIDIKRDEERMYKLRDLMGRACKGLGAMFDERSFDCVYTISFFAGEDQTVPKASRKRYAGDTFTCTQEWFGIDITTYKENAYRETRAQTGASSAMLGAGVGTAAGLVTSGAMGRALDRQKAEKGAEAAKKEQGAAKAKDAGADKTGTDQKKGGGTSKSGSKSTGGSGEKTPGSEDADNSNKGENKPNWQKGADGVEYNMNDPKHVEAAKRAEVRREQAAAKGKTVASTN